MDRRTILFLGFVCAATVANAYYNQPLLAEFAREFGASSRAAGLVSTCSQIGYGIGILLLVPLADSVERKRLLMILFGAVTLALIGLASAQSMVWLYVASLACGVTTVIPQIIIPYAAGLARPTERASVVGGVQAGLLVGILLARTVSGAIADVLGWRWVYALAALLMLVIAALVRRNLPKQEVAVAHAYVDLLKSMVELTRTQPTLRWTAFGSALSFAGLAAFWTTLAFFLESPVFGYGPGVAGAFGIVGAIGALSAPWGGRLSDRRGSRYTLLICNLLTMLSFVVLYFSGHGSVAVLIAAILLLDVGAQNNHIANQAAALQLVPGALARLNGVYMFGRFCGGALGSLIGSWAWADHGLIGVCIVGFGFSAAAFFVGRIRSAAQTRFADAMPT